MRIFSTNEGFARSELNHRGALGVTAEALLAGQDSAPRKRGPAAKIQQHLERISRLPKPKQKMLMEMIDAVLARQGR